MAPETLHPLDHDMLEYFESKGREPQSHVPSVANDNAVKVRRIMQIVKDLANRPVEELSILDLGCGEGVYAIETAFRGAKVRALDARTGRMKHGIEMARKLKLDNLEFEQADVRQVTFATHGSFDVIFFLGILYHLDAQDACVVLQNLWSMCRHLLVIDTQIALDPTSDFEFEGKLYRGAQYREHADGDPDSVRKDRLLSSIDNTFSFWFSKESLIHLLLNAGFTSVFECHAPPEPFKQKDRITLIAIKTAPVIVSCYPWINGKSEDEIKSMLAPDQRLNNEQCAREGKNVGEKGFLKKALDIILRRDGMN